MMCEHVEWMGEERSLKRLMYGAPQDIDGWRKLSLTEKNGGE